MSDYKRTFIIGTKSDIRIFKKNIKIENKVLEMSNLQELKKLSNELLNENKFECPNSMFRGLSISADDDIILLNLLPSEEIYLRILLKTIQISEPHYIKFGIIG